MRKVHQKNKNGLQHVHLLHDNVPAHKSSAVLQFFKSEKVSVLSHPPYSPDLALCDSFLSLKLKKHLFDMRYRSRSVLGSAVHQFLMGVPKDEYENCFKSWIKRLKQRVAAKGEYLKVNRQIKFQLLINISEKTCHLQKFLNTSHLCIISPEMVGGFSLNLLGHIIWTSFSDEWIWVTLNSISRSAEDK